MLQFLVNQFEHMHWANQKVIDILGKNGEALDEAIKMMGHVVSAEHIWLSRMRGQDPVLVPWTRLTLPECREYTAAHRVGYLDIIRHLNEERFRESISFLLTNGKAMSSTRGDILCHVPIHGAHHRGQILRLISQNDIKPPAIDYVLYSMQSADR